jgi:hypothetical protein
LIILKCYKSSYYSIRIAHYRILSFFLKIHGF